jgi:hypothetical protein
MVKVSRSGRLSFENKISDQFCAESALLLHADHYRFPVYSNSLFRTSGSSHS